MEHEFWHQIWADNEIGFHQPRTHRSLTQYFPKLAKGSKVLVPLCGKSKDMLWLAEQGYSVTGIELVEDAVVAFFEENNLAYDKTEKNGASVYRAEDIDICLIAGDFFAFEDCGFDALYDRAALVALPESMRQDYTDKCRSLLKDGARIMLVVFDYDQTMMDGPPFSLSQKIIESLWGDRLSMKDDFDFLSIESPFKDEGFTRFREQTYLS